MVGYDLVDLEENSSSVSEAEQALVLYNRAAQEHGFAVCHSPTDARRKRIGKRLADIGGLERFTLALSAIPLDDFLMGHTTRNGQKRFKLGLDFLLSTESKMGDVLARLVDSAMNAAGANAHNSLEARIDAEVRALAQSNFGKQTLATEGEVKGLAALRRIAEQQLARSAAA
jgi:hypothetical protein